MTATDAVKRRTSPQGHACATSLEDLGNITTGDKLRSLSVPLIRGDFSRLAERWPHLDRFSVNVLEAPLEDLDSLALPPSLSELRVGCDSLESLKGLERSTNLKRLDLRGCIRLSDLQPLLELPALEWLAVDYAQMSLLGPHGIALPPTIEVVAEETFWDIGQGVG